MGAPQRHPHSRDGAHPEPSDSDVVRRVLEGHRDDYEILIRRYQGRLHRFCLGMVNDPDVAADLVQDSFVRAYLNLDRCWDPSGFGAWVHQILRNRCRDFLKNPRRAHESLEKHPELASRTEGPSQAFERSQLRRGLRNALATLPRSHREALLLKDLEGRTYREIAEMMGTSVSAVKMRVHRSREMLRSYLEETDVTLSGTGSFFGRVGPDDA